MEKAENRHDPKTILLKDDGTFPNNAGLPLLLYTGVLLPLGADAAEKIERLFNRNGWPAAWRNGVYPFQHYHSTAHEALGIYRGWGRVQFGGPGGPVIKVSAGDVAILPAGVAHKRIEASADFALIGAYPPGQTPDMNYGEEGERPGADHRIAKVPTPDSDPVLGAQGGVPILWE